MSDPKDVPRAELSLKYMAWNIKEMSENTKKIAAAIEGIAHIIRDISEKKAGNVGKGPSFSQEELPF